MKACSKTHLENCRNSAQTRLSIAQNGKNPKLIEQLEKELDYFSMLLLNTK